MKRIALDPPSDLFVPAQSQDCLINEALQRPSITYWQDAWMRLKTNKWALASGVYIVVLTLTAFLLPPFLPYSHFDQEVWNAHLPPSLGQKARVIATDRLNYEPVTVDVEALFGEVDMFSVEPPESPGGLEFVGEPLTIGVILRWQPVPGAESYLVYRAISADTLGVPLGETSASVVSFYDVSSLRAADTYYYRVVAANLFAESESSQALAAKPTLALPLAEALTFDDSAQINSVVTTKAHYLGTDYLGRDMLARVLNGAQISLLIGFGAPLIYILIGIIYGAVSGYFGGVVDDVMMRIADIVSTVPELLAVIMLQVFLGSGVTTLIAALVLVAWARSARQIRGEVLKIREMEYVYAGRILGTSTAAIIRRHLLPNVAGTILVLFTLAIPQAIFTEAFLSFIGLGIAPPQASWGTVTREGARVFLTYPYQLIIPASMICLTMFAFNMLGDGLRDALDPKLRGGR